MKKLLYIVLLSISTPLFSQFNLNYYTKSKRLASASGYKKFNYIEIYDMDTDRKLNSYSIDFTIYINFENKYEDIRLNEGYITIFTGDKRLSKLKINNGVYVPETSEWSEQWKFAYYSNDFITYFLDSDEIMIKDSNKRETLYFSNKQN